MYQEGPEMEGILVATAARPQNVDFDDRLGGRQHAMTPTAAQSEQCGSTLTREQTLIDSPGP
jgi:hypothetical protein